MLETLYVQLRCNKCSAEARMLFDGKCNDCAGGMCVQCEKNHKELIGDKCFKCNPWAFSYKEAKQLGL